MLGTLLPLLLLSSCDGNVFGRRLVEPDAAAKVPKIALQTGQELVASCGSSKGYSYYPEIGMVPEEKSGFSEDAISDGYFYLLKQPDGAYDLVFRDALREQRSAVADGAIVQKLRGGPSDAAFMVIYQQGAKATEIYTFYREAKGKLSFTTLVSKGSEGPIARSGILVGACDHLALDV
ncbi:MAG TPA: hypothetical protein VMN38_11800 [Sphingomicrobium sp.]|nr:hypothetical protein [Sphingomicrobium sp.]